MLLSGATVGLIEVYQFRALSGLSAFSLRVGSCRTRLCAAGWTPGPTTVDVEVAADQPVVDIVGVDIEGDLDAIRECLAIGVGCGIPLIVADQVEALAGLQVFKLVRTGGDDRVPVLGASVLVLGDRHRVGLLGKVVERCERRFGVEDDRVLIRRLNSRVGVHVRCLVRTLVAARQVEDTLPVRRAVGEGLLVGRAQYRVLHVGRGDLGAVVELDALTQLVGPGLGVAARLARAFGEIRHQLVALLARCRFEHHQRATVEPGEIPRVGVVGLAGIEGVPVTRVRELQRATLRL